MIFIEKYKSQVGGVLLINEFNGKWKNVQDGCGFNCNGCGVKESNKVLFGYLVKIGTVHGI